MQLKAIYGGRRRQVILTLVSGVFAILAAWGMALFLPVLPFYSSSMVATDGNTLYLVAQSLDPEKRERWTFFLTHSKDGGTFSTPTVHSGQPVGFTALAGCAYCLFPDGSLVKLSGDSWTPIPKQLDWPVLGIAAVDNQVLAFGQNTDRTRILAASLDNETWRTLAGFRYSGDNIDFIQGLRAANHDYLLWTEHSLPKGKALADRKVPLTPQEVQELQTKLRLARLTGGKFEVLPSKSFHGLLGVAATGDDKGILVFFQEIRSIGLSGRVDFDPRIQVVRFQDDAWGEASQLKRSALPLAETGDMTAATLDGKTFLYTFDSFLGVIYAGLYGTELRAGEPSRTFAILPPSSTDLTIEIYWALLMVAGCFVTLGALAGLYKLKSFEHPAAVKPEQPLYATVTDRAAAAVLDFSLVYTVIQLMTRDASPGQFWITLLMGYVLYGTTMESLIRGQTLGKKLLGLRVLSVAGTPITFSQALTRNLFKFLEMVTIGVGACFLSDRLQRFGDVLAGTVVVKEFRVPAPPLE